MNFGDMVLTVQQLIGDETDSQFKSAQIKRFLNMGQRYLAAELECIEKTYTNAGSLGTYGNIGTFPLPTDFIRARYVNVNGYSLEFLQNYPTNELPIQNAQASTVPTHYYILNASNGAKQMAFYPSLPGGTAATLTMHYTGYPADMVNNADISALPETGHELIVMYALARCKLQENDYEGYQFIMRNEVRDRLPDIAHEAGISTAASQFSTMSPYEA